jgi:Tfp pilus assembly protein PilX
MSVKTHREQGMALVTALLVLVLVSSMIVGLAWMVMTDQRLGNNNSDRQRAFYAAEAGMESMAAALAAQFNASPVVSRCEHDHVDDGPCGYDRFGHSIHLPFHERALRSERLLHDLYP